MLLEVRGLSVSYGRVIALTDVDLQVAAGQFVALIGANGAGKSSLLRAVSGLVPLRGGQVSFDGKALARQPAHEIARRGLAHVPEGRGLLPNITVAENLRIGAYGNRQAADGDLDRVLGYFPALRQRLGQSASVLSGGEQQMLSIGRALLKSPKLLMIDEMSLGLAPKLVSQLFEVVLDLKRAGLAVLCVEQHTRLVLEHADHVYGLKNGRLRVDDTPDALRDSGRIEEIYLGGPLA